jgi:Hypothetical glycosyl hydrolase family 15
LRNVCRGLAIALAGLAIFPTVARAGQPAAGHFRLALDTAAQNADYSQTPAHDDYLVLQGYQVALMHRLKAADPNLKVLVYKDLSAMVERDQWGGTSTGVATQDAAAHPEWYLLNTGGQRFTFRNYDWMWAADIGNAGFQQKWADNVLADVSSQGWDGVFMDDVNPSINYHYDVSSVAAYPSDAAYQAATGSALQAIGARFRAAHKLVIPNFGFWKDYPSVISHWLQYVDGGMDEMFVKVGADGSAGNYVTGALWETQLQEVKDAAAQGKAFLGVSHSSAGDEAAARYGWATMLLGASGDASFAMHSDYANENWFPEYDYALGTAAAAESRAASGVHRRAFTNGLVLVNPTTASVHVDFGGAYTGSGLTGATATTMAPHSALVLAKAGGGAPFQGGAAGADGPSSDQPAEGAGAGAGPGEGASTGPATGASQGASPSQGAGSGPALTPAHGTSTRLRVRCRAAHGCQGRVALRSAGRIVAQRSVKLRAGQARTVSLTVRPWASASAAHRHTVRFTVLRPRGTVARRHVTLTI